MSRRACRHGLATYMRKVAYSSRPTLSPRYVAELMGVGKKDYDYFGEFGRFGILKFADFIDPTCTDFGGSVPGMSAFECSRCGAVLNVGEGGGLRTAGHYYDDAPNGPIAYCPNCGARVVRSDDVSAH
ncbi:MAG: hypothetical protein ACI360_08470 [Atopobiaceae bacterium]